jgi:hypothetical protein
MDNNMKPGAVTVCFYRGTGPFCWAVRADTRRPGQAWKDVPAHCSVAIDGVLYEFISSGYHCRYAVPADYAWSYAVPVPDIDAAERFALSERGDKYGFSTDALIVLSRLVPDRWLSFSRLRDKRICSWFAREVLMQGGWRCPYWLIEQYEPETPNDILFAVRETLGLAQK